MRWPIQVQLLLPILLIVVVAIALASATSAWFGSQQVRHQQEDNLRRVVGTLTGANFPLTERVLQQMSGLSGAEFVLLDEKDQVEAATLPVSPEELQALRQVPAHPELAQLSASPGIALGEHTYLSQRVPVVRRSLTMEHGSLLVLYREDRWRGAARQAAYPALVAGAVSALAAVVVASLLAQRFVWPLKLLGDQAARFSGGNGHRVTVPGRNDEIRDLALCINRMMEKLSQYESEVRRNERLSTLGQLGAGMAHQLRNSATGARIDIELHQRECGTQGEGKPLEVALRQLRLMESYLQRFLSLGRSRPAPHEKIVLARVLDDALQLIRPACAHNRVELCCLQPDESLIVRGEADSLCELLVNLLMNALEAATRRPEVPPRITIEVARDEASRGVIRIIDSGAGPSVEVAGRLFEPFVTGKPEGTGLGLFVARQIAEAHGASIGWERRGDRTCFSVELPLIPTADYGSPACC